LAFLFLAFSCSDDDTVPEPEEEVEVPEEIPEETVDPPITYSVSELTKGAALKGANGVDIGPDGNLYIGSVLGLEIAVMDKENGTISERFGPEMQVIGADNLVFGPDGSLYWTDILVGEVGRKELDGTITK
jgi:sugar lactone lactonase YvrE